MQAENYLTGNSYIHVFTLHYASEKSCIFQYFGRACQIFGKIGWRAWLEKVGNLAISLPSFLEISKSQWKFAQQHKIFKKLVAGNFVLHCLIAWKFKFFSGPGGGFPLIVNKMKGYSISSGHILDRIYKGSTDNPKS